MAGGIMSEKGGFEENKNRADLAATENPFHDQLRSEAGDHGRHSLQDLSPDKRVFDVAHLGPQEKAILQNVFCAASEQWDKVIEPLRNVFNNWKRQEMSGTDNGTGEAWSKNYFAKVGEVLRDNMTHLAEEIPFRVAIPVQSFLPGQDGYMNAKTLTAFFPPLQTDIHERYITMPLHSADPALEAQLRKNNQNLATGITSHELHLRAVQFGIIPRKDRPVEA
jgi:hypothetical protein